VCFLLFKQTCDPWTCLRLFSIIQQRSLRQVPRQRWLFKSQIFRNQSVLTYIPVYTWIRSYWSFQLKRFFYVNNVLALLILRLDHLFHHISDLFQQSSTHVKSPSRTLAFRQQLYEHCYYQNQNVSIYKEVKNNRNSHGNESNCCHFGRHGESQIRTDSCSKGDRKKKCAKK